MSLCLLLEHGRSPRDGIVAKQALLAAQRSWSWLGPPDVPGTLTVLDAAAAAGTPEFGATVRCWASSVWAAWSTHAPALRARVDVLLGSSSR